MLILSEPISMANGEFHEQDNGSERAYVDLDRHGFGAAAAPYAANRRNGFIIAADSQPAVGGIDKFCMGNIDAYPSGQFTFFNPYIDPCMACSMDNGACIDIAGDVTRWNALRMAACKE